MLRGYRGPALAVVMSLLLLGVVVLTRLTDNSGPAPTGNATPRVVSTITVQAAIPPTFTPAPTLTPAPTIALSRIDTSTLNEALISPSCALKLNPILAGFNQADRDISALIYEGLFTTDQYGAPVPDLAAAPPDVSDDGLTYSIRLQENVLWQDGQPFTSDDVLYTIHVMQDPAFPGPSDLHDFWSSVELDAITPHWVRFKLSQPLATFLDYLRIGILPEHALRGTPASALANHPFNLLPIGTGPYQMDRLLGDGQNMRGVRLRLSPSYLERRADAKDGYNFRQIAFRCYPTWQDAVAAFQRGEVNSLGEVPYEAIAQIKGLPLTIYPAYRPALGSVIYNWRSDSVNFLRDPRMRQALALSVDRRALVDQFMADRAVTANSPILPLSWAYSASTNCPTFDPAKPDAAKEQLGRVQILPQPTPGPLDAATPAATAQAPSGPPVYRFDLLAPNDAALVNMAKDIVAAWQGLGLNVNLIVVDEPTLLNRLRSGTFDAALVELNFSPSADPDPYSLWRQVPEEGGLNFGGMNERMLSELLEKARRETNGPARVELYRQFQQLFCDRAAALLLYYPVYYYAADQRIAGIQLGFMAEANDRFRTIHDWRFTTP